ncbi:Arc family DNA binding domain-containing protein [bacterium]|jgi:hypothetical protein|nr:Arc family DNA binding domain-containing protein [bacterium]
MGKQRKNYPLRLPADLFEEIRIWAEQEMRSVNGQMEYILRQATNTRKSVHDNQIKTEKKQNHLDPKSRSTESE